MNGASVEVGLNCSQSNFTNRTCFEFSKENFDAIMGSITAVSILAAVTSIMAIVLIVLFKAFERFVYRLTLYVAITALANAISLSLQIAAVKNECGYIFVRSQGLCVVLGFSIQYLAAILMVFVCWITVHMFLLAALKRTYKSIKYEVGGVITCLAIPLVISIFPFIDVGNGNMYGLAGVWCWIKSTDEYCNKYKEAAIEQLIIGYGPLLFATTFNFVTMLAVIVLLCRGTRGAQLQKNYKEALKEALPLLLYPICFDVIVFIALVNRLHYTITKETTFGLWVAHAVAAPCLYLFVPLAFLLHPYTLKKLNCHELRRAANKWRHHSENSHTHFIVSREDTGDSEDQRLIVRGTQRAVTEYKSYLEPHRIQET